MDKTNIEKTLIYFIFQKSFKVQNAEAQSWLETPAQCEKYSGLFWVFIEGNHRNLRYWSFAFFETPFTTWCHFNYVLPRVLHVRTTSEQDSSELEALHILDIDG